MSDKFWQERLRQMVAGLPTGNGRPRITVVGVGHELRGDDGAGPFLARMVSQRGQNGQLQAVEAGPAPENCNGQIARCRPDLILFVDAAEMGAAPGAVRWLDWEEVAETVSTTHSLSLAFLANYLAGELGCSVALIGIQPASVAPGTELTPAVAQAVEEMARALDHLAPVEMGAAIS